MLDPAESPRLNRLPRTERDAGDDHERDRNQHGRPAPGLIARARELAVRSVEVGLERARICIPGLGILGETASHNRLDLGRHVRADAAQRRRLVAQDGRDEPKVRVGGERPASRQHLVEHRAEREDVRPRGYGSPFGLLGRHVGRRAHDEAWTRVEAGHGVLGLTALDELRQAEVEDLGAAVAGYQDVGWLDVAMDDAASVRGIERRGNL